MKRILLALSLGPAMAVVAADVSRSPITSAPAPAVRLASAEGLQSEFLRRFLEGPGRGYRRVLAPDFYRPAPELVMGERVFTVRAPDLIGLSENPAPTAYVARPEGVVKVELTNRTTRAFIQTRPLTSFEKHALADLQDGRDLVLDVNMVQTRPADSGTITTHLRALGAIRATRACTDCHDCEEGKLLGAFSYELWPSVSTPAVVPPSNHLSSLK